MKRLITLSVEAEVYDRLHAKAHEQHMSASALGNDILCRGLDVARPAPVRRKSLREQAVLHAIDALISDSQDESLGMLRRNRKFFTLQRIAKKAGFYPSQALQALAALTRDGVLYEYGGPNNDVLADRHDEGLASDNVPEVEHWGYPPQYLRKAPEGA